MDRTISLIRISLITAVTWGLIVSASNLTAQSVPSNAPSLFGGSGVAMLRVEAVSERASEEIYLGQNQPAERKGPGFFERIKRSVGNWVRDDEETETMKGSDTENQTNAMPTTSIPMTPPKPVTATEIKQSNLPASDPEKLTVERETVIRREPSRERSTQLERRMANVGSRSSAASDEASESTEDANGTYHRLEQMRNRLLNGIPEDSLTDESLDARSSSAPSPQRIIRQPGMPSAMSQNVASVPNGMSASESVDATNRLEQKMGTYTVVGEDRKLTPSNATNPSHQAARTISRPPQMQERFPVVENTESAAHPSRIASPTTVQRTTQREKSLAGPGLSRVGGIDVGGAEVGHSPWNQTASQNAQNLVATTSRPQASRSPNSASSSTAATTGRIRPDVPERLTPGGIAVSPNHFPAPTQDSETPTSHTSNMRLGGREKALLVSPLIEVETEGDSRVVVGQESTYRVRLRNRGGAAAEQVVLTVDVPNWIDILPPDVSTGTTAITPKGQNKDSRDFTWKISRVDPMAEEQLVLHLVPMERKTVDLRIRYDFHKSSAVARIEVQEPVIEMELQGPDEVLWGSKVGYKLIVRNTGNGDAEKVNLELLQTGSDMKSCPLDLLKAGEEQIIDVDVWTGKQDHIDINILATGAYELTSQVSKRVAVLRPELSVSIESAEMQFVDSPADFHIVVRNEGNAPATNLELTATIPLGARYVSNNAGGKATPQNQVLWTIPAIPVGEEFVATVICEPKREGTCKLEASINDSNGLIANCSGTINAEAIADLKMEIENPQGPIEVGQEAVFTINVSNRGTKAAEDVEVIAAFARGLEPFAVEGGNGTMNDGQVVFDKIPSISAGQTVTLKVKGKADRPGNHRMRTEVICPAENTHLVFEQATYFYQKYKSRNSALAEKGTASETTSVPTPLNTVRGENEPQPLRQAPPTANTALLREDPFLR